MSKGSWFLLLLLLTDACSASTRPAPHADLLTLVRTHGALGAEGLRRLVLSPEVRTIDDIISRLPDELVSRYVLLFDSRSLQGATFRDPRVILYSQDAKFVIAFGGSAKLSGYHVLETMTYDEGSGRFAFREIALPADGGDGSPTFSEPNPPRCLVCHGPEPHPIWDTYPIWPGAYGEQEHAHPSAREEAGLKEFLVRKGSSPRYQALIGTERLRRVVDGKVAAYDGKDELSSNAVFGLLLQDLNYRAIAREVTHAPGFESLKYALLASLDPQCSDIEAFVPPKMKARFRRQKREFERETIEANTEQASQKRSRLLSSEESDIPTVRETLTPFRYLVEEGLLMSTSGWTLALERATFDFTSARPMMRHLERDIFEAVVRTDPDLSEPRARSDRRDDYCTLLKRRSLSALGDLRGTAGAHGS